ncbi:leucyl aminopeptidase family protein [Sphingobium phenoxybenzoativorans]|uniref:Leucyl aminopeptidase family protein n=1 Tax=Sphingobium phenoxybenzoativorans TaxID=1592790 RepID=A0A975K948_9SPHN|nr:leucyl aminopeptidase family protein [Sphingobium phenoxybenzoativorans]QUT06333.1 leucyl aminopeptidase family protein [Sphingobium phenoxybenzoativorans]
MTDYAELLKADHDQAAHAIQLVDSEGFPAWLRKQPERVRTAITGQKFSGKPNEVAILPGDKAAEWSAVGGVADTEKLSTWCLAKLAETLPEGTYRLHDAPGGAAMLGWLTAQYRFETYRKDDAAPGPRILLTRDIARIAPTVGQAEAVALVRDLVNTPAADMGPADLESAAVEIAEAFGAVLTVVRGEELQTQFPMIHAVGRAADRAFSPRLIEFRWGDPSHPKVAIVGKGVSFDSGGLDIKPSSGMRLMKKDMGGAAHALALAMLVMESRLPVRLHLLIPAVENAISGNAFRPGDILRSRKGLSVEIGNTDAEGRLILGDALAKAVEDGPEMILDFATLTGAARVALGPDLPALFANDDALAADLERAGGQVDDPLWRLPLWSPYADMLKSDIADINNAGEGGFAGSITAALFLQKFVPASIAWAHFDTFAWRPAAKPGRPKGGEALGLRAAFAMLQQRYGRTA